jgi:hypothetical protein
MPTVLYRFIAPKPLSERSVRANLLNVVKKYEKILNKEFNEIVAPFSHQVNFTSEVGYEGGNVRAAVYTDDEVFGYLEYGTSVRYATMKKGFQRKTEPGQLATSPGDPSSEWVKFVSTKFPHKGLTERRYTKLLREKYGDNFVSDIRRALHDGLMSRG